MKSIITRLLLVLMAGFAAVQTASADISEKYTLSFSLNDFSLTTGTDGNLNIVPDGVTACYPSGNVPGLPLMSKDIAVFDDMKYKSFSVKLNKRLVRSNVTVAQTPTLSTAMNDSVTTVSTDRRPSYIVGVPSTYPDSNCRFVAQSELGNVNIVHFITCPFIYNVIEKKLYFIDSMELTVVYERMPSSSSFDSYNLDPAMLKDIVTNPERLADIYYDGTVTSREQRIDYLVITKNSLKSYFTPLTTWKKTKGLYSSIKTIEEIEAGYSGSDTQEKIKNCLYDMYRNNGLRYVLLGGDDTVVPVRRCFAQVNSTKEFNMPTDMYYACFGGDFRWDGDGDSIYGEPTDSIDLVQSIFVTRAPVRSYSDVNAFVRRQLAYEKQPVWNNNMLLCGNVLKTYHYGASDAQNMGNDLFKAIRPLWDGSITKFFDTFTNLDGVENHQLSPDNLTAEMAKGYNFMDMITHGAQDRWKLEGTDVFFSTNDAKALVSSGHTIITTMTCKSNAFDTLSGNSDVNKDPCLSEAFFRNPESGVLAYLGCSREGWFYTNDNQPQTNCGPSLDYTKNFYTNLFSNEIANKNYGTIVALAKTSMIGFSEENRVYRWVQFGLNPIGDPEMPVFTEAPKSFDNVKFSYSGGKLILETGVSDCRICVMSSNDGGKSYYRVFRNVDTISLADLPLNASVCITKQGYIPAVKTLKVLQNTRLSASYKYDCDVMLVGSAMTTKKSSGPVIIEKGKCEINAEHVFLGKGIEVKKGAEMKIINTKKQ